MGKTVKGFNRKRRNKNTNDQTKTETTMKALKNFIGAAQLQVLLQLRKGEEGKYFEEVLNHIRATIESMPKTYETDGQGKNAIAYLHYFTSAGDWWITERDTSEEQLQAFGYAYINGFDNAEFGYISIKELIENGAELDLYSGFDKQITINDVIKSETFA